MSAKKKKNKLNKPTPPKENVKVEIKEEKKVDSEVKKVAEPKKKSSNNTKTNASKPAENKKANNTSNNKKSTNSQNKSGEKKTNNPQNRNGDKKVNNSQNTKKEEKTKEEEIVFKNVTKKKPQGSKEINKVNEDKTKKPKTEKVETKKLENKEKEVKVNNINTEEFFEEKENKTRKAMFVSFVIAIILLSILVFSTIFAILDSFKMTIANGVSINGIDISSLTYDEAKQKMIEAIEVQLLPDIELYCGEYKYTVKIEDISYEYDLETALEKAYNVGKTKSIVENNYALIKTAIFGEKIVMDVSYNEPSLDAIIDIIDTNIPGRIKEYSYYIDGSNLVINPGVDGIHVKNEELKTIILESIKNRKYSEILKNYETIRIEIPYDNVVAKKIDAAKISEEVYAEPQNAYYVEATDTTEFQIYPAKPGVAFAITAEEAQALIEAEEKGEYIIPLTITEAQIQLKDIGVEAFPYKIQTFSTSYDASNYSRSKNLEIAASKINGTVLMPGEVFSFNAVVGERTVSEGYRNAKIYSNGQVVDGLAGGICQVSSTLYNAALLSNLEIVERFNHSFTTSYVAAGRDATVVYGIKDLKFKNSRNYPIKLEASVANGIATFSIYGIKEEEEYTVKIIPKTTQTIPYTTRTIVDPTLAPGTMQVTQAGASGRKVTTYKETYLNGILTSSEVISNDVYQVMTRIVKANPAVETPAPETPATPATPTPETPVPETPVQ